jgi:hypothetical protein
MGYFEVKNIAYTPTASKEDHKEVKFQSIHKTRCEKEVKIRESKGVIAEVIEHV